MQLGRGIAHRRIQLCGTSAGTGREQCPARLRRGARSRLRGVTRRDGKPIELPKPPAPVPELTFVDAAPQKRDILISTAAMERVTELAPRWDKYFLEKTYCAWAADKDPAHNEDARFFGWGQKLHQGPAAAVTPMTQIHNCLCRTSRSAGAAAHKVCAQGYSASPDEDPEH
jgi:hypothetical protein